MGSYLEEWQPAHNFTFSDNVLLEMLENATATVLEAATATPSPTGKRRAGGSGGSMAWWQQLAWTLLFSLMLILAIGGNAIVMWIVLGEFMLILYLLTILARSSSVLSWVKFCSIDFLEILQPSMN